MLRVLLERTELLSTDEPDEPWAIRGIVLAAGQGGRAAVRRRVPARELTAQRPELASRFCTSSTTMCPKEGLSHELRDLRICACILLSDGTKERTIPLLGIPVVGKFLATSPSGSRGSRRHAS